MKKRLLQLIFIYILIVIIFILQKPLFMFYYHQLYHGVSIKEWGDVIFAGLPLDLSFAGYLTIIPGLLAIVSVWTQHKYLKQIYKIYFLIVAFFISGVFIADLGLYEYWGFRIDSTPLFYFMTSPKDAMASVSVWVILLGVIIMILYAAIIYYILSLSLSSRFACNTPFHRINESLILLLTTALLFIPIRGGFTVSTMNVGKVYFSENQKLNHAAINPCFSLIDSFMRQSNFDKQYRFFDNAQANNLFSQMIEQPQKSPIPALITQQRPNIIMIIMESFSSYLLQTLESDMEIAPHLDSIASQSILFTNFYANSFRTDRGLVSILSGYPAQPTTSIMKYPRKTQSLPSIPKSLKEEGYNLYYYYGGDADFTNMRSYLVSMGIDKIVCDKDFPSSQLTSKWGAHDEFVFDKLWSNLEDQKIDSPFFVALQTSSSHEPFDVPFHKFEDSRLNAFAYTDRCIGTFINQLKESSHWNNTLVMLVPDHLGVYPYDIHQESPERFKIPLILTGGVITNPTRIDTIGSQIDIAATLLSQLEIPYNQFPFSKNLLNASTPHFAFFTMPNFFGWVSSENEVVYNCESNQVVYEKGKQIENNLNRGKAFLQKLYDDLENR